MSKACWKNARGVTWASFCRPPTGVSHFQLVGPGDGRKQFKGCWSELHDTTHLVGNAKSASSTVGPWTLWRFVRGAALAAPPRRAASKSEKANLCQAPKRSHKQKDLFKNTYLYLYICYPPYATPPLDTPTVFMFSPQKLLLEP